MKISDIKVFEDIEDDSIIDIVCKKKNIDKSNINNWHIIKKSIDARDKNRVHYNYSVEIFLDGEEEEIYDDILKIDNKKEMIKRPVVIGAGPAGLFAAYTLALNGYNPILLEQGNSIEQREKDVEEFITNRRLNTNSNVQFGEGGAGAFSDGKLTTNVNSKYNKAVLETFVKFGAPKQILYLSKPHIGTDNLRKVIKNMREEIIRLGGEVKFNTKAVDFEICNNDQGLSKYVTAVITSNNERIETNNVILAVGHSARFVFEKLKQLDVKLEPKPFSIGVRIEHRQSVINESQYGTKTKLNLPPADYKLVYHDDNGRSLYTFCMCPGGFVMASSSEEGTIVTNGMSYYKRDGKNANSALLVNITPDDFMEDDNPLNGMYFQKKIEEDAFLLGGSNYNAPVQRVEDYLNNNCQEVRDSELEATYKPGINYCDLHKLFPKYVNDTLEKGIKYFGTKINGFDKNAILTAVESRSSCPIRILRDENMNSSVLGIHPCGEGAGYAGGIMTSAIDGIKVANAIVTKI